MSLIQVASSQYNQQGQSTIGNDDALGNTGSRFTNRFNSVLKIPANAEIALAQAMFNVDMAKDTINSSDYGTDDKNTPALALFQGGNGSDKFGTYYNNLKIFAQRKNFSPCDIPMVAYAPQLKGVTMENFWNAVIKRLNLTATPSLQGNITVSSTVQTGALNSVQIDFQSQYNTVTYDGTTTPPNQAQVAYNKDTLWLNNDNFRDMINGSQPKSVKLNPKVGLHAIESIQFEAAGAAPKDTVAWGKRQGMGKTSNNGVSDANGFIEMDYFKGATQGGVGAIHQNPGLPAVSRIGPDLARRLFSFGIDRWESDKINAELQKLTNNLTNSNPFVEAAFEHAQNLFTSVKAGTTPTGDIDLAGYAYPLALLRQGVIKPWICADYFFVTLPKIDIETSLSNVDVNNPKFNYMTQIPLKSPAPQHLAIFGVERGKKLLFTDQGNKGANPLDPTEWTDGLKEYPTRLVCLASGDRMAQIMYGIPYSGWLDPENVPLAGDTPDIKQRRFMALDAFTGSIPAPANEVSPVVDNSGMFSLYDDLDNPFPQNTCMRGLKIINKANKIVFHRLYYAGNGNIALKEKDKQIEATRQLPSNINKPDTWIKEWVDDTVTTPDTIKAVEGFVNIAIYPLQSRFGIGGLQGDLITSPALVPVKTPDITSVATSVESQSNVEDLVSAGRILGTVPGTNTKLISRRGGLNEHNLQAYLARNMIIPNCLLNRDFYDNVTPIINYYPLLNDVTKEFVSTNRRPAHNGLSEDLTDPTKPIYSVASHTSIVVGLTKIFNSKKKLYEPTPQVNPFLQPNISKLVRFDQTSVPLAIFLDGTAATPNYQQVSGSYTSIAAISTDPVAVGLYVHLDDLPNTSVMGSMNQVQTKLVGVINKFDAQSVVVDNNNQKITSLSWNAHELLFVKLNNPSPIELSQLNLRLTDRFMNPASQIQNTQLVFYLVGDEPKRNERAIRMM
tara:strand:- start:3630 stop:6491 length:2862 start_codon:yes stop_codon:yes gene_type:complete